MTVEHRLVFGLDDIVAVVFECRRQGCGARLSMVPSKIKLEHLRVCPACDAGWLSADVNTVRDAPVMSLARFVVQIAPAVLSEKEDKANLGVSVRLEFAEPKA
jgi:hypothetical protein